MREPSHLGATLRLVARALRTRAADDSASRAIPRRRIAVERQGIEIDARRVEAYRRLTGGGDLARTGAEGPLPPTYPALWETALALELLAAGDFPLPSRGLIHVESETFHLRPLRADDRPRCRVELDRVEEHPQGLRLSLLSRDWSGNGQLCRESRLELLARAARASGARARREELHRSSDAAPGSWEEVEGWDLPSGQGRRYARVSGDFNPIHLWAWSSRPFGFHRPVLHGFCLEAMVAHALVRRRMGGEPDALRRLRISFRRPLLLPARVRLQTASGPAGSGGRFRVVGEEGKVVAEGEWVG